MTSLVMSMCLVQRVLRVCVLAGERSKFTTCAALRKSGTSDAPRMPSRPLNPFFIFMQQKMQEVRASNPDLNYKEIMYHFGHLWNTLPSEEKQKFQDTFMEGREAFQRAKTEWWTSLQDSEKRAYLQSKEKSREKRAKITLIKRLQRLGKPRRPMSANSCFVAAHLSTAESGDVKRKSLESLAKMWKTMNESERKPYKDMAKEDLQRFMNEKLVWDLKMMSNGQGHLIYIDDASNPLKSTMGNGKRGRKPHF